MNTYSNIPTNIISGFLGAGKTTAIQYLLKHKPDAERWAVIVNEFGQIGIDGALLENSEVEIKEIPGGCLCCVGSQSLNVGLNQLIRQVKPHRILIEPTGLGHPAKLIESLSGGFYESIIDLKAVINLIDARQLSDDRYIEHETFIDQVRLADILVATKLDTYSDNDKQRFYDFAMAYQLDKVVMVENGKLNPDWLDLSRSDSRHLKTRNPHQHVHPGEPFCDTASDKWLMVEGSSDNYMSVGWKINNSYVFSQDGIVSWLNRALNSGEVERVKGYIQTDKGWISINHTRNEQQVLTQGARPFSILEFISPKILVSSQLDEMLKTFIIEP